MAAKNVDHLGSNLKAAPAFSATGSQAKFIGTPGGNPSSVQPLSKKTGSMSKLSAVPVFPIPPQS